MAYNYEYPYTDIGRANSDWILKTVKDVWAQVSQFTEWRENHEKEYEELKLLYDKVMGGNFPPSVTKAFEKWMQKNALDLVGHLVKNVFFGLNDDGYFVAYIPESWHDIIFNTTGLDITISDIEYGRLVLSY